MSSRQVDGYDRIGDGHDTHVTISSLFTKIEHRKYACKTSLKSVNLPSSLTEIGDDAFYYCTSLTSVATRHPRAAAQILVLVG